MVGAFIRRNRVREMKHTGVKPDRGKVISIAIKKRKRKILQRVSAVPGASSIAYRKAVSLTWI